MAETQSSSPIDVFICITCRGINNEHPGIALQSEITNAIAQGQCSATVRVHGIECMSVCTRPCTVAVSSPRKWSYIVADLNATHTQALCDYLNAYAASEHGTPPLKERPAPIRSGTIARIPPQFLHFASEDGVKFPSSPSLRAPCAIKNPIIKQSN